MKGNKLVFSNKKEDRIKGYKKLLKAQDKNYQPKSSIIKDIVEAMEAQGYEVDEKQVKAYLKASYAVHDRSYYLRHSRGK